MTMSQTGMAAAEVRPPPPPDGPAVATRWKLLAGAAGIARATALQLGRGPHAHSTGGQSGHRAW